MEYELSSIKGFQAFVALIEVRHNGIRREALSISVVIFHHKLYGFLSQKKGNVENVPL